MPGHVHAANRAMEARYEAYKDTDMEKATEFLLTDPDDQSQYVSIQYFRDNAINVCMDSTYAFVKKVIQEVKAMHAGKIWGIQEKKQRQCMPVGSACW